MIIAYIQNLMTDTFKNMYEFFREIFAEYHTGKIHS